MAILIRDYHYNDFEEVKRIHANMGLDYQMPELGHPDNPRPLLLIRKVAELNGKIVAAGVIRLEAELLLWVNHEEGEPEDRWKAVQLLNEEGMREAWLQGIDHCVCWVPEEVEKSFAKRLKILGFTRDRDGWHSWSRPTEQ